jgi:uncharacterized protein YceH (UPF0502 family)
MISRRLELAEEAVPIITLLLLRGPQTPGELRSRSARMREYESPRAIEDILQKLRSGDHPLVVEMARLPGQKETRWMHLIGGQVEAERAQPSVTSSAPAREPLSARVERLEQQVQQLQHEMEKLLQSVGT